MYRWWRRRSSAVQTPANKQARQRIHRGDLADQPVGGERRAQYKTDPQLAQRFDCKHGDAGRCDRHSHPLQPGEFLLQDQPPQQDVRERVEIIAKAASEDVPAVDRIDVQHPVDADQRCGSKEQHHRPAFARRLSHFRPAAGDREQECEHRDRPQHTLSDDIDRRDCLQQLEVDREDAPQTIGCDAVGEATTSRMIGLRDGSAIHSARA